MGNITSSASPVPVDPPPYESRRRLSMLSRLVGFNPLTDKGTTETLRLLGEDKAYYGDQLKPTVLPVAYPHSPNFTHDEPHSAAQSFAEFLQKYPEYALTAPLDTLRATQYTRLAHRGDTFVDFASTGLYPEMLTTTHTRFLNENLLSNMGGKSHSAQRSIRYTEEARRTALKFFGAPEDEYGLVLTPNGTAGLKLVGEAFPFAPGGSYVLSADSHDSVNGVRQYALDKGATVVYIPSPRLGGLDSATARVLLDKHAPKHSGVKALFVLTVQSNVTNSKMDTSLIKYAAERGYSTMVDPVALVPTAPFSLSESGADAMTVSFSKMFGYSTGLGALIAKKTFLRDILKRPYFAGGDFVQVPGPILIRSKDPHSQFEDGSMNYIMTRCITQGLNFLSSYQPYTGIRISTIIHYMWEIVPTIVHDSGNRGRVAEIVSRPPSPRVTEVGKYAETGSITALLFYDNQNNLLPLSFIEFVAVKTNIALRVGLAANSGGVAAMMGIQKELEELDPNIGSKEEIERQLGRELGVVRISWGLISNFQDVWNVLHFIRLIGTEKAKDQLWEEYCKDRR
ncbi:hypothetical protein D9756_011447 [Leucocoprinus leucothites]|uniref:Aminotransferase class V domain-containing protein n=1 Tax=Leucocoprinus leucothites TaxID=201217 RepID=A0A8H5CLZ6_9AGAR|nr:hypothetical protein D9756_011447 [Leucoagaricus leucothites]